MGGPKYSSSMGGGPKYCSMKITEDIRKVAENDELFQIDVATPLKSLHSHGLRFGRCYLRKILKIWLCNRIIQSE